tara:strand:+ start:379 stop:1326 length:948 start_codon:yes stop_codon:yes gene_type:complete
MARNPYFKEYTGEQNILEDLTIESIKTMGKDMVYIPRTLVNVDDLFGEDVLSKFDDGYQLEMYIQSVDGFEGEGDILAKFGLEIRDRVELVVSRKRFEQVVGDYESIKRPREGDLIFFPLSKTLFEINFVEHENPFYQLGRLYTYKLSCEVFSYSQEEVDTGYSDIDVVETERKKFAVEFDLGTRVSDVTYSNYFEGETVFQVSGVTGATAELANATATAVATDWESTGATGSSTTKLTLTNIVGTISTSAGQTIKGAVSSAEYEINSSTTTTVIIPQEPQDDAPAGDNENIELTRDQDDIFDFTETDPFSEGNY